jgi:GNAT superfamily N-acetyltransferase
MVTIVKCEKKYWDFVRELRMNPAVISGFIQTTPITKEDQEKYMSKNSEKFLIALFNNEPAGFIGVIDNDIRVCTHPDYQNKKVGKALVKAIELQFPEAFAKIKINNIPSQKLFESCGFTPKYIIYTNH